LFLYVKYLSACKFVPEKEPVGRPPEKGHLEFPFLFWNALEYISNNGHILEFNAATFY
jgi:hypothetical protein